MMKYSKLIVTKNLEESFFLSNKIAELIAPPFKMTIDGALGAGKTTFIKGVLTQWGVLPEIVNSPSFNIIHQFTLKDRDVFHLDLYRLKGQEQFDELGMDDFLDKARSVFFIEWAYQVKTYSIFEPFVGLFIKVKNDVREYHFFSDNEKDRSFFLKLNDLA